MECEPPHCIFRTVTLRAFTQNMAYKQSNRYTITALMQAILHLEPSQRALPRSHPFLEGGLLGCSGHTHGRAPNSSAHALATFKQKTGRYVVSPLQVSWGPCSIICPNGPENQGQTCSRRTADAREAQCRAPDGRPQAAAHLPKPCQRPASRQPPIRHTH